MSETSGGVVATLMIAQKESSGDGKGAPMPAPEIRPDLDSARILNGEHGPILCVVAGGQIAMYRLPVDKLATLMETGFATIRERVVC